MLKFSYIKSGVGLFKTISLACPITMGEAKLALHKPFRDLGERAPCTYPILYPMILSKFLRWEEEVPKLALKFQIGTDTQ
jgi:hypothetical protein